MRPLALVVVGCSHGGLQALDAILAALPATLAVAVAVVQHRGKADTDGLIEHLRLRSALPVQEIEDKASFFAGHVYIAPPDYHVLIEGDAFALSTDPPVQYARPSIDVLFESAADAHRDRVLGVILTGANGDGARGLARIMAAGGTAVVEDPATAHCASMPKAAIAACRPDHVVPLARIGALITELVQQGGPT